MHKIALVSIVIPTHSRPQFLPRAVESAFLAAPDGDVEIIVIPNGPDESWKEALAPWRHEPRVVVSPIETAHGDAARNHGMALAHGKYLRFLDDDDYLYAESAAQCEQLDASDCDVSLGGLNLVDGKDETFRQWPPVGSKDFVASMLRPTRNTHNCALLWLRARLADRQWDTARSVGQDTAWVLGIARDKDLSLLTFPRPTGVWAHHGRSQTSGRANPLVHNQITADILRDTIRGLKQRSAFAEGRRAAAAEGLWRCIHNAFPLAPRYWSKVIDETIRLAPESRPSDRLYSFPLLRRIDPRLIEWGLTPQRLVRYQYRQWARAAGWLPPW